MEYTEILKSLREDNDLTQQDIANYLNCSQTAYSKWEKGQRDITIDKLIKLAKFYNVSLDYIAGLTKNPTPQWTNKEKTKNKTKNNVSVTNNGSGNITMGNIKQK